jgi:pyruvate kinase
MLRRTNILTTLGPATDDPKVMADMIRAGADVVRLNFSHGKSEDHIRRADMARQAGIAVGKWIGVLGDLQGPKIRIDRFADGKVILTEGDEFTLDVSLNPQDGTAKSVGVAYKKLPEDVKPGDVLLLNDGQISLEVFNVEGPRIHTKILVGGELSDHKGINRQGGGLSADALTERDREHIKLAASMGIDYLAVSFVRSAADVEEARRLLKEAGGDARIVAKIERVEAIENLTEIVRASDAIMVARGDLGVEVGYAELTGLQKHIIEECRKQRRVVITATQMMESMITNPIPTRAEVSDVANAVLDGTDAVMLSAESATGKYPVKAVESMSQVIQGAEKYETTHKFVRRSEDSTFKRPDEAVSMSVMYAANHMDVKAIVALTESGDTPRYMSRIRSDIPIYAFTRHEATRRRVTLYRGVYPVSFDIVHTSPHLVYPAIFKLLMEKKIVEEGDMVILTGGELSGVAGRTNSMTILQVHS